MTSKQFNDLSLNDRTRIILKESQYLTSVDYYNYRVDLYSISNYFVEVKLTAITTEVQEINVVKGIELDKFINRIELPSL